MQLGDQTGFLGLIILLFDKTFGKFIFPRSNPTAHKDDESNWTHGHLGNTALVFHNKKLLALMEGGFPFLLKACKGFVESVGVFVFGGQLDRNFTAHPKRCPDTGELHAFSYQCASIVSLFHVCVSVSGPAVAFVVFCHQCNATIEALAMHRKLSMCLHTAVQQGISLRC